MLPHLHEQILVEALKESKRPGVYDLNKLYDYDQLVNIQELSKRGWSHEPTERPNAEAVSNRIRCYFICYFGPQFSKGSYVSYQRNKCGQINLII